MEEPPHLGGATSESQLAADLNEIVQASKRRALPSGGGNVPTTSTRPSIVTKRQKAFAAIISGARRLTESDAEEEEAEVPSPLLVEQIAYRSETLLAGATEPELDQIVEFSAIVIESPFYIYNNMLKIGVFDTAQGAARFLETKDLWTLEYIRLFVQERGWVGVALLCALLHHSPLVPGSMLVQEKNSLAEALISKYSQSVDEDYVPKNLREAARQRLEAAVAAHSLDSDFFSMKRAQVVKDGQQLTSMTFSDSCPLFSKYDNGRLLSSGSFGVVFKYARRDSLMKADNVPLFCVVKIQRTTEDASKLKSDTALRELLVMRAIDTKIRGWIINPVALITNSVTLYDWVKCNMSLPRVLKTVFESSEEIANIETRISSEPKTYQILVEEYVEDGDIERSLESNDLFWTTKGIASVYAQLFGFFMPFYAKMGFMHNDFKTPNVLLKRVPTDSTLKYLHYNHPAYGSIWVPLEDSHGFVFKLADFGLSMITVGKDVIGEPSWRAQPGLDLEVFTVWLLYNAARFYRERYMIDMPHELLRFLRSIILPPKRDDRSTINGEPLSAASTRAKVISLLSEDRIGKPTPDWDNDSEAFLGIYTYAKNVWRHGSVYTDHRGTVMIERMFGSLKALVGYDKAPPDLASHNACDMTPTI